MSVTQTNEQRTAGQLCIEACKADNVSLMEKAISIASKSKTIHAAQNVVQRGFRRSAARGAVHVFQYLVDHPHGADVTALKALDIMANEDRVKPSQEILEILVAHGWDINTRGSSKIPDWPLLRYIVEYPDLVRWCLDHGARVDIPGNPAQVNGNVQSRTDMPRLLSMAASHGSVETFELLRAEGAPMDPGVLHCAVEHATILAPREGSEPSPGYTHRMDMVRHLVDVVKLDVNAAHHQPGREHDTPLCIVAGRPTNQIFRGLVYFLLDRGADPNLNCKTQGDRGWPSAIACAEDYGNMHFLQAVKEWKTKKQGEQGGDTD